MALVERVEKLAQKKGCTSSQLAIAWLLHKSPTVIPMFGTRSFKNLEGNAAATKVMLTPEEFQAVDSSFSPSEVGCMLWNPTFPTELNWAYAAFFIRQAKLREKLSSRPVEPQGKAV